MKKELIKLFCAAVLLSSCHLNNHKKLSVGEFTQLYSDSLRAKIPNGKFIIIDDATIKATYNETQYTISSDNLYRAYQAQPDSLSAIIKNNVSTALTEIFVSKDDVDPKRIVPTIKPNAYLDEIKAMMSKQNSTVDSFVIYERYNDELVIAYGIDHDKSIRFLNKKDFNRLGISTDSLKKLAMSNLKAMLNPEIRGGNGIYFITAGGTYEASLILFEKLFSADNMKVKGDVVIAIPNRDLLLITGSNDKENLKKIKQIADERFSGGDHQITNALFRWNGKKFIRL